MGLPPQLPPPVIGIGTLLGLSLLVTWALILEAHGSRSTPMHLVAFSSTLFSMSTSTTGHCLA
ncbi:hypothetical protein E2C01_052182 [Portunus trituberculatus]|uniref:Uncharacterized protein n=1 Tax=Portunus trituberculatus TaxID=210409 RepID=A0A5B7GLN9_PORTR|nr:hypothetical protein [Portunus trituberculatus]